MPLGLFRDMVFTETQYPNMAPQTILVFGTDGIWETMSPSREQYGKERLCQLVRNRQGDSAQGIVDQVVTDLARFRGDGPQEDDVTLVIVKFQTCGAAPSA